MSKSEQTYLETGPCKECHHRPSEGNVDCGSYVARCYCKCHDIADAAPELLAALERLAALDSAIDQEAWYAGSHIPDAFRAARAAISKARGDSR